MHAVQQNGRIIDIYAREQEKLYRFLAGNDPEAAKKAAPRVGLDQVFRAFLAAIPEAENMYYMDRKTRLMDFESKANIRPGQQQQQQQHQGG